MSERIYPPEGGFIGIFQDHEGYVATLKSVKTAMSNGFEGGPPELQLEVDWELPDDDNAVRDWIGLALGIGPNGPSKLRQLLNALAEKKPDVWCWFNKDTLEWGYEKEGPAFSKLLPGAPVLFRGVNGLKKDGTGKFSIKVYQPAPAGAAPAAASPPPPAAATTTFSQISPDGKFGWNGTAWIPIEAPAPPPPPSAPPPPPPPPATSSSGGRRRTASSSATAAPAGGDDEPPF